MIKYSGFVRNSGLFPAKEVKMKIRDYKYTVGASYLGYICQAVVNNFVPLLFVIFQHRFGLSLSQLTALITVNFFLQLTVDALASKFVDRIGVRKCVVAAHISASLGLILLAVLPAILPDPYTGLIIAVPFYALGGGLIEVLVSPIVESCPSDNKAAKMSLLHSFYCWGSVAVVVVSTGFLKLFGAGSWPVLSCIWAVLPAFNAAAFTAVPIRELNDGEKGMSVRELFSQKNFVLFVILMFAAGASELSMSQWASALAEQGLGISKTLGDLAGPCLFALMMGVSRVIYAKLGKGTDLMKVILVSGGLCVVSYLITALSPVPWIALFGFGLCGLSVGVMWPGVYSIASETFPRGGAALFALLALGGDIGCTGGPTVVGFLAGLLGGKLQTGIIFGAVFPGILLIFGSVFLRGRKKTHIGENGISRLAGK